MICPDCEGRRGHGLSHWKDCDTCRGSGYVDEKVRTLAEVDKDIDKIKEEFDRLLAEKSKIEMAESKYFSQHVTFIFYNKDKTIPDETFVNLREFISNMEEFDVVVLEKDYKYNRTPISKEEYDKAADL